MCDGDGDVDNDDGDLGLQRRRAEDIFGPSFDLNLLAGHASPAELQKIISDISQSRKFW